MKLPLKPRLQLIVGVFALLLHIASASGATITISPGGMQFFPTRPTINVGDTVIWTQDGETHTVSSTAPPFVLNSGILSAGMTYTNTFTTAGTFEYRCNIHPSSPVAYVVVQAVPTAPPTFSFMSPSVAVPAGQELTFSVSASGTPPLIYQWVKDGVNVPGATNSTLTFTNVQPVSIGNYTVVIANAAGSVTSSVAMLAIPGINSGLWRGLVAYYKLNDGSGTDSSIFGNHAVGSNVAITTDRFNKLGAASFPLDASYLKAPTSPSLEVDGQITMTAWVKAGANVGEIITKGVIRVFWEYYFGAGQDTFFYGKTSGDAGPQGVTLPATNWSQVVVTVNESANQMRFYLNGMLVTTATTQRSGSFDPSNLANVISDTGSHGSLFIGNNSDSATSGASFTGSLDDIRIYNRALSSDDVAQLYASESVPKSVF